MSLPEGYRVVEVPESRKDEFIAADLVVWADISASDTLSAAPPPLDWGVRTAAVEAPDGSLAAVHASYAFTMPVPGATVPCSGLTWVGVLPHHRRNGLLSAMIAAHFERSLGRGEPVSALFASEPAIYGRFGYGAAADDLAVTVPRGARLRPVAGSDELTVGFTTLDVAAHADLVDRLHRAAGAGRPGWVSRDSAALRDRFVMDLPAWRDGAEQARIATVHASDGTPRGYAVLRRKEKWEDAGPRGVVRVREAVALDDAAAHRLWSFLLDLDLTATVEARMLAVDDRLVNLLVDRRAATPKLGDNLWLRVLDVPAALAARRYAAPVEVVLDVTDELLPANAGRWRVATGEAPDRAATGGVPDRAGDGGWPATVTRTDAEPDLRLGVRELGAAYLGGRSLVGLVRAGLVEELRPGAAAAAATAFGWPVAPVCSWVF